MYYYFHGGCGIWADYDDETIICAYAILDSKIITLGTKILKSTTKNCTVQFQSEDLDEVLGYVALGEL